MTPKIAARLSAERLEKRRARQHRRFSDPEYPRILVQQSNARILKMRWRRRAKSIWPVSWAGWFFADSSRGLPERSAFFVYRGGRIRFVTKGRLKARQSLRARSENPA